jgi:hypothetical protein
VNKNIIGGFLELVGYPDIEYALVKITDNLIFDFEVYHPL